MATPQKRKDQGNQVKGTSKENLFWKKVGYIALFATLLSGVADFLGIIRIFSPKDDASQLTIYIQGTDGKPIPELQDKGRIIIDFGNDRRAPLIGENGRTNIGEIPKKFLGKKIPIVIETESYESTTPNKHYVMDGQPIYITVRRNSNKGLIQGIVKDRSGENFIPGALVIIDNDTFTYTNNLGLFSLQMPELKQRDQYFINVKKEGYKSYTNFYIPNTRSEEIRLEK